jgi:hypothetical protein
MSPRFILLWNNENDPDRNARRVADSLDEAVRGVQAFLDGETVWDEEKADAEFYEDTLTPALLALADEVAGDDLAASWPACEAGSRGNCTARTAHSRSSEVWRRRA